MLSPIKNCDQSPGPKKCPSFMIYRCQRSTIESKIAKALISQLVTSDILTTQLSNTIKA